jgi:hypothetical protein
MHSSERRRFVQGLLALITLPATSLAQAPFSVLSQTRSRPFYMLVLGDSVVWGQGIQEEHKFYSIVKERITTELLPGREVHHLNLSHSGAHILPKNKTCPSLPGEVPSETPTIHTQMTAALSLYASVGIKPEDVNLVLLNGGINDIGVPTIVNPFTKEKKIVELSKKFCFEEMKKLLGTLAEKFPNAWLVTTGYFPIISQKTDPDVLLNLISAFLGLPKGQEAMRESVKRQKAQLKRAAQVPDANLVRPNWLIDRLTSLSDQWKRSSDADLAAASKTVKRGVFVGIEFSPDECYAASNSSLWQVTGSSGGIGNFISDDQMFLPRQETCRLVRPDLKSQAKLICPVAGTGHPNVKGAKKYADAIMKKLQEVLPKD